MTFRAHVLATLVVLSGLSACVAVTFSVAAVASSDCWDARHGIDNFEFPATCQTLTTWRAQEMIWSATRVVLWAAAAGVGMLVLGGFAIGYNELRKSFEPEAIARRREAARKLAEAIGKED